VGFGELFIVMVRWFTSRLLTSASEAVLHHAAWCDANRLIHWRAWKVNSQKLNFRFTESSDVCSKNTLFGGYARPSTRSRLTSLWEQGRGLKPFFAPPYYTQGGCAYEAQHHIVRYGGSGRGSDDLG
jgi:hypothetical protein